MADSLAEDVGEFRVSQCSADRVIDRKQLLDSVMAAHLTPDLVD